MSDQKPRRQPATSTDDDLVRMVLERGLATEEEIHRCLDLKAQLPEPVEEGSLPRLVLENQVLTPGQMERVKKALETPRGQIPGYKMICRLGAGAMASVYKAKQLSLDRMVAIKVLSGRLSENAEYVRRFYAEGKAAAKLNHPNIVQAIDVGEANGYHFFVMECVEGHTLHELLTEGGAMSEADALKIVIQIARALEHAHEQGFIHRDVKPKNIMITEDGTAKLADMGLARVASDDRAAHAEAGRTFGTPYYISPEQIRGDVDVDFRSDIYSLGATLYHALTGRVPFDAPTPAGVMYKHLTQRLVPPDHVNTALSTGVGEVVEVMMAKNPRRRYASTSDLLVDLELVAAGEAPRQARQHIDAGVLSGLADEADDQTRKRHPPRRRREKLMLAVILLMAALAVSVAVNVVLLIDG